MIDADPGSWLTPTRLERVGGCVRAIGSAGPSGVRIEIADVFLWKAVGGIRDDIGAFVELLETADLVVPQQGHYRLTKRGRQVATQDHRYGGTLLVRALIEAGVFYAQGRRLVEASSIDTSSGVLTCPRVRVVELAPQLVGALRRFPDVTYDLNFRLPPQLVSLLDDAWIGARPRSIRDRRKQLGDRGEEFSYRWERSRARDRTMVRWVAQDDDGLGYDIEDLSSSPNRRIEVKSSSGDDVRFFLSDHEWSVAQEDPEHYEIHFWGGVRLDAKPLDEYRRLVEAGFPLIYRSPARLVREGLLELRPSVYSVGLPPSSSVEDGAAAPPADGPPAEPAP